MSKYGVPSFMKRDGDSLVYDEDGELVYFVPEQHFESNIAVEYGTYISLLGEFNYARYNKSGKIIGKVEPLYFPSIFLCKPSDIRNTDGETLSKKYPKAFVNDTSEYRQLVFRKGDQLVENVHVPQVLSNAELMFKLFLISGHVPNTIPYDELHNHFKDSMNLNGADYGVTMQLFGMIISEICRDKDNESIPFRLGKNIDKSMHDYKSVSVKAIPQYIDPYSSFTSEYYDESIMSAILLGNKNAGIPVEKVLTTR